MHDCPHNSEATGFGRESVNLIRTLPDIAKETFNSIRTANIPVGLNWWTSEKRSPLSRFYRKGPVDGSTGEHLMFSNINDDR